MIQKGIIAQVIDKYNYKVRIPKYDKIQSATYSVKTDDLASGIVCTIPGIDIAYSVNDVVLISFENGEISKPIILGLLYRNQTSDSDISVGNVDSSLTSIRDNIDKINNTNVYTHVKYSNDNGLTFTSLFSNKYYESSEDGNIFCRPYYDEDQDIKGIQIDKTCRVINWSIIDDNNVDITSTINKELTVFDSDGNVIKKVNKDENLSTIPITNSSQISGDLYLDYKLYISKEYLDTLHVSLTTDKDTLGSTQGEYLGINVSTDSAPSLIPSNYHWVSFNTSLKNYLSELKTTIDLDINERLLNLKDQIDAEIGITTTSIFYKDVAWTEAEVGIYCQQGYSGIWSRDLLNGYNGEIQAGNILYITVRNTGEDPEDTSDDSYGRLTIRATANSLPDEPAIGTVLTYDVSGELAIDALARFKSSLLTPGDETLIYGGRIETGTITAEQLTTENIYSSNRNSYINLGNGTFSYTNPTTNQGIVWDGSSLSITGSINANSIIDSSLLPDSIYTELTSSVNSTNSTVTFYIHVYENNVDITNSCSDSAFSWYMIDTDTASNTYGEEVLIANSGKSITINFSSFHYSININCYYTY